MLKLQIKDPVEWWDAETNQFRVIKPQMLKLEHSLLSVYKWESKWHKPFLSNTNITVDELIDYFRCMCINSDVDPLIFRSLTREQMEEIRAYIDDPMTATTINSRNRKRGRKQVITAEIIYYWMTLYDIPLEFEKRHLNHLLMLIEVCDVKSSPGQKMNKKDLAKENRALNEARKRKHGSRG